jgi:NhaA family Na+:H+ antiporter
MATDIAFALGMLALLGSRIPLSLKVFLTALAIIDDLGAIAIIAIFYNTGIAWAYLLAALGIFVGLLLLNRLRVHRLLFYLVPGVVMWYCMLQSGVHATITGVLLAFAIPLQKMMTTILRTNYNTPCTNLLRILSSRFLPWQTPA